MTNTLPKVTVYVTESRGSGFYAQRKFTKSLTPPSYCYSDYQVLAPDSSAALHRISSKKKTMAMNGRKFSKLFMGINTPKCKHNKRIEYPIFEPDKINVERFSYKMRPKTFDYKYTKGDEYAPDLITVKWITQEWDKNSISDIVKEIDRCFSFIGYYGLVELDITSSDYPRLKTQTRHTEFHIARRVHGC